MSLRLNVLDAAANSLVRLVAESPKWLSAMLIPWLLASAIYTYAAYAVPRAVQIGAMPGWLGFAIFLPFSAIVVSAVLNNIIHRKPCGPRSLKISEDTGRVALVLLALLLAHLLVDFIKDQLVSVYINQRQGSSVSVLLEEMQLGSAVLTGMTWLFTCLATAIIYPMMPVVIDRKRFDFERWSTLIKMHGWRFFLLTVLLSAAYKGFEKAYLAVMTWTGSLQFPEGTGIMQEFLISQFLYLLFYLPTDFIAEILPAVAAGTVYVALLARSGSDG